MKTCRKCGKTKPLTEFTKYILTYILIFWFWFNPYRALNWFSNCYLENTTQCVDCWQMDLNDDNIVNLVDLALLVE